MSLLRARNDILAHIKEKRALHELRVVFAKREKAAQLSGLFTRNGLRRMLKRKSYYAADMVFPFIASFNDKSLGFEGNCELSQMNVQYSDIANKVLVDQLK